MDEADMSPAMDQAIRTLLGRCFPADNDIFAAARYWHGSPPAYSFVASREGALCGHVGCVVRDIRVGGQTVRIAGIQSLAAAPECRGTGLGLLLMTAAMDEAAARGVPFGLLFCVPGLGKFYAPLGWRLLHVETRMDYRGERDIPIPGKNITMIKELAGRPFPPGDIHLCGADW